MVQNPDRLRKSSSIIVITHEAKDLALKKILKEVARKNFIRSKPRLIRIDDK